MIRKIMVMLILLLMFSGVFAKNIHDNNKIIKDNNGVVIEQKENKIDDKVKIYKDESIAMIGDTYYNKYGGVNRSDLKDANIKIKDKFISVTDYNSTDEDFEVSMYVGTNDVKYAIMHHNTSQDYNYISLFGDYIGDVISKDGYLYYDTDLFSSQIATIPSHYSEGVVELSGGIWSSTVVDELDIDLEDYFTGVKKFTICDNFFCDNSGTIPVTETIYNGLISLTRSNIYYEVDTLDNYQDQLINIIFRSGYNSNDDIDYNRGLGAFNDELQVQVIGDDNSYYYSGFYLTYFFPDESVQYGQQSTNPILDSTNYIFLLEDNDAFVNKGFSSTLITLDDDENFGFKINEHYLNYDTWGIRLNDDLGVPIAGSGKELERYMTGCQSYSNAEIEVQICSNNYKGDLVYIRPQGVDFDGSIEIYACNNEYDACATEKSYEIDILIDSPDVLPILDLTIPDLSMGYYEYESIDLDDYFSGYTSFDVDIDNTACEISKVKDVGLSSTCTIDGVVYDVYPNGLITIESSNVPVTSTPIYIVVENDIGINTDTFLLSVGAGSLGTAPDSLNTNLYYTFDTTNTTGTTMYDTTPNDNDGTCSGMTNCNTVTGKLNQSTEFDGLNDYISFGSYDFGTSFSINAWINTNDNTANQFIIGRGDEEGVSLRLIDGVLHFGIDDQLLASSVLPSNNAWTMVTATYDGTSKKIYVNGVNTGSSTGSFTPNYETYTLATIGARRDGTSLFFDGEIDEVAVLNYGLSSDEIDYLYQSDTPTSEQQWDFPVGSSSEIPPGVTTTIFDDVTLLPEGSFTYDMNEHFYGYNEIELKYYSTDLDEWFSTSLSTSDVLSENILGNIIIELETGTSLNGSDTIFATVDGQSLEYDDLVYITASNEVGATTPQTFNVFVDYTAPVDTLPENSQTFPNVGLEYESVENINLNDYYNFYDYVTLSIGVNEITVYLNGTNDFANITTLNYNVSLENIGTYIALTILSNVTDDEFDIVLVACNDAGCDSERTFTTTISEEGVAASEVPLWFPNPPENEKLYWAISIMTIFIVGIAIIGANDDVGLSGVISFGLIGLVSLFILFSVIGWIPIWILILLILLVVGYVSFMLKNMIGGQ